MLRVTLPILAFLGLFAGALGFGLDLSQSDNQLEDDESEVEGRLFIPLLVNNNGNGLNLNATILAALVAALASAFTSLLSLAGLGLLMAQNMDDDKDKHHHTSYHHHDSGYRRSFNAFDFDWETISLTDWIGIIMDTWNNFDPTDMECQKTFICQIHQNTKGLGPVAETLTYYFSYLRYGEVLSLPMPLKILIEDYVDAADKGRSFKRSCSDLFPGCDFSVKGLMDKYKRKSNNNIHSVDSNSIHNNNLIKK